VSYANGIIAQFIQTKVMNEKQFQIPAFAGMTGSQASQVSVQVPAQVIVQDRMWYNQDLDSAQYMIPGIIAILLTVTSMMFSAMSLVKEKELGTWEQLMVTPVTKTELLLGKLIPYWIISMIEIALVSLLGHIIFGIHFSGSVFSLGIMAAVFLLTSLGLGIFISTVTHTQQQAMFFAWFVMVFMLLLSGLFIPIQNMPVSIRRLTLLNPMSYFMIITREIIIKGNGLVYLWKECLALLIYGIGIFMFSVLKFHKRV
jgi:ABC-2 type transport system permease protein